MVSLPQKGKPDMTTPSSILADIASEYMSVTRQLGDAQSQRREAKNQTEETSRFFFGLVSRLRGKQETLLAVFRRVAIDEGVYTPPAFDPTRYMGDNYSHFEGETHTVTLEEALSLNDEGDFYRTSDLVEVENCIGRVAGAVVNRRLGGASMIDHAAKHGDTRPYGATR